MVAVVALQALGPPPVERERHRTVRTAHDLAAPLGGFLAARFGSKRWLSVSIVMSLVMLSLVTVVPGGIPFIAVYMIYGFVGTLGMAARSALIQRALPTAWSTSTYAWPARSENGSER